MERVASYYETFKLRPHSAVRSFDENSTAVGPTTR